MSELLTHREDDDLVAIARIARPRGIRGEVIADLLTDFPERFDGLDAVWIFDSKTGRHELPIENAWLQNGRIVLKFSGIDTVEQAETLRNCDVCVIEGDAVELEDDEFYEWQLFGCEVVLADGTVIGIVRDLLRTGGTDVLVIDAGREILIPFAAAICVEIDIDAKRIVIDPPDGLLDI